LIGEYLTFGLIRECWYINTASFIVLVFAINLGVKMPFKSTFKPLKWKKMLGY